MKSEWNSRTWKKTAAQAREGRPTFALLIDSIGQDYQVQLMAGATDAAREHDVNLVCYIAGVAGQYKEMQFNVLYEFIEELIDPELCDALILSNTFAGFTGLASFNELLERYRTVPIVSIAPVDPRIPHISVDNLLAMRVMLAHFIEQHNCRRIAIIRGPEAWLIKRLYVERGFGRRNKKYNLKKKHSRYTSSLGARGPAEAALTVTSR